MEKTLKDVAANSAAIFSHLAERSLRHNWRLMSQVQKERLLNRFHFWIETDSIPVSPKNMEPRELEKAIAADDREFRATGGSDWPQLGVFVGNWPTHASGGYFETFEEALDDGFEALLEEWDAQYVIDVWLSNPPRCPIAECRQAAAIMRLERNKQ